MRFPGYEHTPSNAGQLCDRCSDRVTAAIASGKRPDPFRTRKLSPIAPTVLRGGPRGRVGRRRTPFPGAAATPTGPRLLLHSPQKVSASGCSRRVPCERMAGEEATEVRKLAALED